MRKTSLKQGGTVFRNDSSPLSLSLASIYHRLLPGFDLTPAIALHLVPLTRSYDGKNDERFSLLCNCETLDFVLFYLQKF